MRKKTKRMHIKPSAPMLVCRGVKNDKLELVERMTVEAFTHGYATPEHFDVLTDMNNCLLLAATSKPESRYAVEYSQKVVMPALKNIKERYLATKKLGCNSKELSVLRKFVTNYREFWMRQPLSLYEQAYKKLRELLEITANEAIRQKSISA